MGSAHDTLPCEPNKELLTYHHDIPMVLSDSSTVMYTFNRWTQRRKVCNPYLGAQCCHLTHLSLVLLGFLRFTRFRKVWSHHLILDWQRIPRRPGCTALVRNPQQRVYSVFRCARRQVSVRLKAWLAACYVQALAAVFIQCRSQLITPYTVRQNTVWSKQSILS